MQTAVVAGFSLEWLGVQTTILLLAACYLATTLSLLVNPSIHDMDRKPRPGASEEVRG